MHQTCTGKFLRVLTWRSSCHISYRHPISSCSAILLIHVVFGPLVGETFLRRSVESGARVWHWCCGSIWTTQGSWRQPVGARHTRLLQGQNNNCQWVTFLRFKWLVCAWAWLNNITRFSTTHLKLKEIRPYSSAVQTCKKMHNCITTQNRLILYAEFPVATHGFHDNNRQQIKKQEKATILGQKGNSRVP